MEETLNGSITESTSVPSGGAENGENPFADGSNPIAGSGAGGFGGGGFGDPLAPDEGYEYDFGEDSGLPMQTPFDQLLEFEEFDNLGDILGDVDPSDNPFAGGGAQPDAIGDSAPEGNSNNLFDSFNPNTDSDDVADGTADGVEEMSFAGGGSMMNADFSGIDTGAGNIDNGNGNNFLGNSEGNSGSNNQADGNGNWFYGNDNQAGGNGNWNFGDGNQVNGNGNWNLNEEGGTPFNSIFEGENNPLTGGNSPGVGEEGGIPADALGGNNPVLAGGSTTPTPVGEGETPDTVENPTGNQNTVNGNGNWNFGSDNNTSGNGNWNFGDGNVVTEGNANWNLGDNNEVSGNGNRPSGNDNSISGNSNRVTGDGNSINGNRFELDEDSLDIFGNADRYFAEDEDGNVSLVSDESASDPNLTFDFDEVVEASADGEVDELPNGSELPVDDDSAGQDVIDRVYGSLTESGTGSLPDSGDGNSFGGGDSGAGGGNPFGGGDSGAGGGNPFANFNPLEEGNPLVEGDEPNVSFGGAADGSTAPNEDGESPMMGSDAAGGENPFGSGAGEDGGSFMMGGGTPNSNTNPDYDFSTFEQSGESDPNELIRQSPFGPLLDLPGIDGVEDIFGNIGGAGGENPFGGGTSGVPDEGSFAIGDVSEYVVRDENDEWFISEDDVASEDDTSVTNPEIPGVDSEDGGNPFEFDPTADLSDSSDIPAGNTFLEGEVPEGLSNEELAVSSEVADSEDAPAEDSGSFGGNPMESDSNYSWDFDFASSGSLNQDSSSSDSGTPELADEELLFDEIDFEIPLANDRENMDTLGEAPVFNTENNEIELPNGANITPFNEDGEFDPLLNAPVLNEDGIEIGDLEMSFPEFIEDYISSVFNSDGVLEVPGDIESEISEIENNFNLPGVGTPVLREDNVLEVPGGFEVDLSGIIGSDSVI